LPPQGTWFEGPLLELARDVLHDESFESNPLWEPRWWRQVLERVGKGEPHLAWSLWQPLITELWRRHFVARLSERRGVAVLAENK
jgi:serine/threonine protein kinase HipA of HipAB toxin-antitoxin module